MRVRQATSEDLSRMVKIDRDAYGDYGASKDYFAKKLESPLGGVLVAESNGQVVGFVVFELLSKEDVPEDFCDMRLEKQISGKWMHPVCFTTTSNYKDKESDSKLLLAAEEAARKRGCVESCVPLSKDHPFKGNGAFEFWEMNGYKRIGEIKWKASPNEFIECYFYKKKLA
jgi:ribosomal protein S18 acetylase RimI-like enzyme